MKTKPSDFLNEPYNSVTQNAECETVARNIMVILKRTGNTFRELTYEEYESERKKDGRYSLNEKECFDKVIDFCKSPDTAKLFSENWRDR